MGHYDEFYDAEAEEEHRKKLERDKRELHGIVKSVEVTPEKVKIVIEGHYYGEERLSRFLKLLNTNVNLSQSERSRR